MNILTGDLISLFVARNFNIIKHKKYMSFMSVLYKDNNRKFHRTNGPAIIYDDNSWEWYFHGYAHRDRLKPAAMICGYYRWCDMGKFINHCIKN